VSYEEQTRTLGVVDAFERRFVGQGAGRRSIEQTLDLAWELLGRYSGTELKRIEPQLVECYHHQTAPKP
jgi:V/A-type H+/Na+-transporting ATPase subunit B